MASSPRNMWDVRRAGQGPVARKKDHRKGGNFRSACSRTAVFLGLFGTLATVSFAKPPYEPGDWVSYTNERYVRSVVYAYEWVYFGTTEGIARLNRFNHQWGDPITTSDGLPDNSVLELAYDPTQDALWAATRLGTASFQSTLRQWYLAPRFPPDVKPKSKPPQNPLPNFYIDFNYTLYPEGVIQDQFLRRYPVRTSLEDDMGSIWYGTWGLGVLEGTPRDQRATLRHFGLWSSVVTAMAIDGDFVWFGGTRAFTQPSGITRWNRQTQEWTYYEAPYTDGLISDNINAIVADSQYVWFGTELGLVRYDKKRNRFKSYTRRQRVADEEVTALDVDSNYLYVGTTNGVSILDKKKDSLWVENAGLPPATVVNAIKSTGDDLWIGTRDGLFRKTKGQPKWVRYLDPTRILSAEVRAIVRAGDELWFGSQIGVVRFNLVTQKTSAFEQGAGTGRLQVYGLAVDSLQAFIAVPGGVWRWQRGGDFWRLLSTNDGLIDPTVYQMVWDGDYLWFATNKGATRFYWKTRRIE